MTLYKIVVNSSNMKNETQLKWPSGDFTHTDFAKANNKTNQQVWVAWSTARKNGIIVSAGTKPSTGGKGKPSLLFKVNPNPPSPVTVSAPAPVKVAVIDDKPKSVAPVIPTEPIIVLAVAPVVVPTPEVVAPVEVASPVPEPAPAAAPVVAAPVVETPAVETTAIVEVVRIEATPEKPFTLPPEVLKDVRTLTEVCPICKNPLSAMNDATGVIVWCGKSKEICPVVENPYGHANTDKNAYEILCDKWRHTTPSAA